MKRAPITWNRALRALLPAVALVLALTFVAANFVLVDVHLLGLRLETRLAWAAVVPAALGFVAGVLYGRARVSGQAAQSADPRGSADRLDA